MTCPRPRLGLPMLRGLPSASSYRGWGLLERTAVLVEGAECCSANDVLLSFVNATLKPLPTLLAATAAEAGRILTLVLTP